MRSNLGNNALHNFGIFLSFHVRSTNMVLIRPQRHFAHGNLKFTKVKNLPRITTAIKYSRDHTRGTKLILQFIPLAFKF